MKLRELLIEIAAVLILLFVIFLIVMVLSALNNRYFLQCILTSLGFYALILFLTHKIGLRVKTKIYQKFRTVIFYPLGIMYFVITALIPFLSLWMHLVLYFGIAFCIPELIYHALNFSHLVDFLTESTIRYLRISLFVIICVLLNPFLRSLVYKISPATRQSSKNVKYYELDKLTNYLLSMNNIKFIVYSAYVVALVVTNYLNFQGDSFSKDISTDKSILQSFVTFIAFDRAIVLMKQLDFRPSRLIQKIIRSISNTMNKDIGRTNNEN